MASKYGVAAKLLEAAQAGAQEHGLEAAEVMEALLVLTVQALKDERGGAYMRGILQYEIDSLGSGGVYEVQRGGGHS